jgi:hypothetical protein
LKGGIPKDGIWFHFGDGTGRFGQRVALAPEPHLADLPLLGDVDGNGAQDVVTLPAPDSGSAEPLLYHGSLDRGFGRRQALSVHLYAQADLSPSLPLSAPHVGGAWAAADLDGDGRDDVVAAGGDYDFGDQSPTFVRVLLGAQDDVRLASNTELEGWHGAFVLPGHFLGQRAAQVLLVDSLTNQYTFFEWQN